MKVSFLGLGNMGSALLMGALRAKVLKTSQIRAYDVETQATQKLRNKAKVKIEKTALSAVNGSDYIFLCIKPQQMKSLLEEIKPAVTKNQCLVSIAAGIRTGKIEDSMGSEKVPVVRVMPNTPAMVGSGASAVCGGTNTKPVHVRFVTKLMSSVGKTVVLPESVFDAVTAVSGSGPAYIFYLAEAMKSASIDLGISEKEADLLVKQTVLGSAMMLQGNESSPSLRQKVTSPGGTTERAIQHLESQNWFQTFVEAIKKAKERSVELSSI